MNDLIFTNAGDFLKGQQKNSTVKLKKPNTSEATNRILSDFSKTNLESVNINNTQAYYSERYGWTLRRKIPSN